MAEVTDTIISKSRNPGTKGDARRLRTDGWVPAVVYGKATPTTPLAVDAKTFMSARLAFGVAHVYDVKVEDGKDFKAIIKSVERDPVNRQIHHIDFFAVDAGVEIHINVRIDLVGKSIGVVNGGIVQQARRRVEVACLPKDVPSHIDLDISDLDVGDSLHIGDVSFPDGVRATSQENLTIAVVLGKGGKEEEAGTDEAASEEEAKS